MSMEQKHLLNKNLDNIEAEYWQDKAENARMISTLPNKPDIEKVNNFLIEFKLSRWRYIKNEQKENNRTDKKVFRKQRNQKEVYRKMESSPISSTI